jgi:phage terminase large subunit-like protein
VKKGADITIMAVDPAASTSRRADRSALVVLAKYGEEIRVLDAIARRLTGDALAKLIEAWDDLWKPQVIVFESNGPFAAFADIVRHRSPYGCKLKEFHQTRDKGSRVLAFSVPVENGTLRLKGIAESGVHSTQYELFVEITSFPQGEHDDLLDACMMGTAYLMGAKEPRIFDL